MIPFSVFNSETSLFPRNIFKYNFFYSRFVLLINKPDLFRLSNNNPVRTCRNNISVRANSLNARFASLNANLLTQAGFVFFKGKNTEMLLINIFRCRCCGWIKLDDNRCELPMQRS